MRPVVALVAIFALIISGFMPLAQAVAALSGAGTMVAAICSPNGVRYVEIDLGVADQEAPLVPALGSLDHCPGCLGGSALAVFPAAVSLAPALGTERFASEFYDHLPAAQTTASFRPRAPPVTS